MSSIDFKRINETILGSFVTHLCAWLPEGKKEGYEYKSVNPTRADNRAGSFSININNGRWSDFATGDKGGDPISLYAYLFHNGDQGAAARELSENLNIPIQARGTPPPPPRQEKKNESPWRAIMPAPEDALPFPVAHTIRGRSEAHWVYRDSAGNVLGVVYRFKKSDGGKEVLPCVYAEHAVTKKREWRWMAFPEPRPLYGLDRLRPGLPVLVVEGEKCRDAANVLVSDVYNVVCWPGGGKAVQKADWSLLFGFEVVIWPDADSKRRKLSKQEVAISVDPNSVEFLPFADQPGQKAADEICKILRANEGTKARVLPIPEPGVLTDGWDIADAIADGWDRDRVLAFIEGRYHLRAQADQGVDTARLATAGIEKKLIRKPRGGLEECRENVYLILAHHPAWQGVIGYNEFTDSVQKLKPTPYGSPPGDWTEDDDHLTGLWLAQHMELVIKSESALVGGVQMSAKLNRFHPVRDYLRGLTWDGVDRLSHWLVECLGVDVSVAGKADYCALAGRYFLIGMVARIFRPGCPMQNMMVFEGKQGKGKSTTLRILGGEWFADTPFKVGDKDSYLALRGKWIYEIAEMDAFNRSETTAVKAFISIQTDHYREPYGRRMVDRHRQTVFCGTTNQGEYFKDTTGNRRFWPIKTGETIDLDKLAQWRDQLFAEAYARFKAGERWHPSRDEETLYFQPEQETREIVDPWYEKITNYLAANDAIDEFTTMEILEHGVSVRSDKVDGNRSMATRVGSIMAKLGWEKKREATGARRWLYRRPCGRNTITQTDKRVADLSVDDMDSVF